VARVLCDRSLSLELVREVLDGSGVEVEQSGPPWSGDDVVGLLSWAPVTAADLERLPALRVVATPSVGYDHVDVEAASARGVAVSNVPDYCVEEMADSALALLLALVRGVVELDRSVAAGRWDAYEAGPLRRLRDLRLGVIGFGRIGRAVAARALALGVEVWASDPLVPQEAIERAGVRAAALEGLLPACNAVSLHAPLTPETQGLIGARELALLPRGSYLVNVARGALVDEEAVVAALGSGRLAGAALDTLAVEPPAEAPRAPRLVVTPHAAWYSPEAEERAQREAAEAVLEVLAGRTPAHVVTRT
jgi:D-3-phosphoglycerate dehydrogenase